MQDINDLLGCARSVWGGAGVVLQAQKRNTQKAIFTAVILALKGGADTLRPRERSHPGIIHAKYASDSGSTHPLYAEKTREGILYPALVTGKQSNDERSLTSQK